MRPTRSIASTLTWVNMLVSGVALLLAAVALGAYDRTTFREGTRRNLSIQAQIIASNSISALVFNDPVAAEVSLTALKASPNIVAAHIFTLDGRLFAQYQPALRGHPLAAPAIPPGQVETFRLESDGIALTRVIAFNGRPVGSVSLESNLTELTTRRAQYLGIIATVLIASMLAALLVSLLSQRVISRPIIRLADLARRVSLEKDYSVRAPSALSANEIVVLTDAFNEMLAEIQLRDNSLHDAQNALEARVQQRTGELEAANQELEAFSYSVSHDLRAPLRHVTGFAALLSGHANGQLDAQASRYLQTITTAAQRMGQLIDDLLAFSRIGRGHLGRRFINLNELVREARQDVLAAEIGAEAREIEWHLADLPSVEGDPAMLRLVLVNLLSNAVKYTAPRSKARIDINSHRDAKGDLVVVVRDNGVGFDMKYAHKLFGVFQRLHSSDEFEGTGIGLANVKRIVQRHGGHVWAESQLDHGATFSFSLPSELRS
jgi:signal transduction histidine kinase